jgi:Tfp pilus assembly protein FimT
MHKERNAGLSLFELLVGMTVTSLLIVVALPSVNLMMQHARLNTAAETLHNHFLYTREKVFVEQTTEAIYVTFYRRSDSDWCYGLSDKTACNCQLSSLDHEDSCIVGSDDSNKLKVVTSSDYKNVVKLKDVEFKNLTAMISRKRTPIRGGTVTFATSERSVEVTLTPVGRVRICASTGEGYARCKKT